MTFSSSRGASDVLDRSTRASAFAAWIRSPAGISASARACSATSSASRTIAGVGVRLVARPLARRRRPRPRVSLGVLGRPRSGWRSDATSAALDASRCASRPPASSVRSFGRPPRRAARQDRPRSAHRCARARACSGLCATARASAALEPVGPLGSRKRSTSPLVVAALEDVEGGAANPLDDVLVHSRCLLGSPLGLGVSAPGIELGRTRACSARVIVEALAGLAAVMARSTSLRSVCGRGEAVLAVGVVHHVGDRGQRVEADEVGQRQRAPSGGSRRPSSRCRCPRSSRRPPRRRGSRRACRGPAAG